MDENVPGFIRWYDDAKSIPLISTDLRFADRLGSWKARWGIGRFSYIVTPGLYAVGSPDADSPVLATANYKMSYDLVRMNLADRSAWLLVLETEGINVWCAAGKGSFGTDELERILVFTGIGNMVRHRSVIVPLLGAPGVSAHEIKKRTGFTVKYGPVRARDMGEYFKNGRMMTAMKEVTFSTWERAVLIPVELVHGFLPTAVVAAVFFALGGITGSGFLPWKGLIPALAFASGVFSGMVLTPLFLPFIPFRSFALKGGVAGLVCSALFIYLFRGWNFTVGEILFVLTVLPAASSFYGLNFTGCTPYTSRSGVKKEIARALPVIAAAALIGVVQYIIMKFV